MDFSYWRERIGKFRFTILVAIIAGVCAWLGYWMGNARLEWLEARNTEQTKRIERLYQNIDRLEYQQNILQVELEVERAANLSIQSDLRTAQDENSAIRRELLFYQRVMAPELEAEGVTIDSLAITHGSGDGFHFRLVLVQIERAQQQLAQGSVSITLRGQGADGRQEFDLFELANADDSARRFAMNYFTRTEGNFQLPNNFVPESIQVRVRTRGGRTTQRSFQWNEVVESSS